MSKTKPLENAGVAGAGPIAGQYCDTRTAAAFFGISASTLEKTRLTGSGPPFVKFGRLVRYHLPTCEEWARKQAHNSTSEYGTAA